MNNYIELQLTFSPLSESTATDLTTATDVMSACLANVGYESFVTEGNTLSAYIPVGGYSQSELSDVMQSFPLEGWTIEANTKEIEGEDWNAEWEKNYFQPIIVGTECVIHSSFHNDIPQCKYDIVIDPKMAFGTGHHATTSQIISRLLTLDLENKSVIDMGTGTGILAILAAMRGAKPVTAIEIDPFAEANARENVVVNGHPEIEVLLGDAARLEGKHADVFIANINRNIILNDLERYAATLNPGAIMILSGFYENDIPMIAAKAETLGLQEQMHTTQGDNWACLTLIRR